MLLWLLASCTSSSTATDTGDGPHFSVLAEDIPGGALLSATDDGGDVLFSGGQIGGSEGVIARYDGESLCVERAVADKTLWWIHGDGAGEWYAVGEAGRIVHATPAGRTREDVPTDATLFGVYMDGADVWAVGGTFDENGSTGEIWRRTAGTWSPVLQDAAGAVFKVWDGWFVGDGVAWHLDGDGVLVPVDAGGGHLLTVRGRAADDVWAVGGLGTPLVTHWDGLSWSEVDATELGQPLAGVWTAPGADVAVAGNFGTVALLQDDGWLRPELPLTPDHLHAAWGHADDVLFAGGNLFSTGEKHGVIVRYGAGDRTATVSECEPTASLGRTLLRALVPTASAASPEPSSLPSFSIPGLDGRAVTEQALLGAPGVLNVWASWCSPCLAELPRLDALAARLAPEGFRFLAVSVDATPTPARGIVSRLRLRLPVALDSRAAFVGQLAPAALPVTWVLDGAGRLRHRHDGELSATDLRQVELELRALTLEQP